MKRGWESCRKLLCIRTDNMGDIIMSGPAIRALKQSLGCSVTLLVSKQGASVCPYVPGIDDFIVWDVPWGKDSVNDQNGTNNPNDGNNENSANSALITELKKHRFDAAVIFTVYSQSALPAALCAMMAGIPLRLAYSRENPYSL